MAARKKPKEIFLSHSHKDHAFVSKLAAVLVAHGLKVWYSKVNIGNAQQWYAEIGKALGRCDWFIVVLTPDAVKSKWVRWEVVHALNHDQYNDRIIPLVRKKSDYATALWVLEQLQRIDFTKKFDDGCRALLNTWKIKY